MDDELAAKPKIPTSFTVRVYALATHDGMALLSRETLAGQEVLKFPGGGVDLGEGILDALKRELQEETAQHWKEQDFRLVYVNGFYVQSMVKPTEQVVAVYYQAGCPPGFSLPPPLEWHPVGQVGQLLFLETDKKAWEAYMATQTVQDK